MTQGIKYPVEVGPRGGIVLLSNADLIRQNILLALLPAESTHPWNQDLTPKRDLIFDIADEVTGGLMAAHIEKVFNDLEQRNIAALSKKDEAIRFEEVGKEGEVEVVVKYVDLEDMKSREIRIGPGGR